MSYSYGTYHGELDQSGLPHGQGLMEYNSGEQYQGGWLGGAKNGFGVLKTPLKHSKSRSKIKDFTFLQNYSNLSISNRWFHVFTGEWRQGVKHGQGQLVFNNGNYFKGAFNLGYKSGFGLEKKGDKFFSGRWECGEMKDQFFIFSIDSGEALEVVFNKGRATAVTRLNPNLEITRKVKKRYTQSARCLKNIISKRFQDIKDKRKKSPNQNLKSQIMNTIQEIEKVIKIESVTVGQKIGFRRVYKEDNSRKIKNERAQKKDCTNSMAKHSMAKLESSTKMRSRGL